MTSALRLLLNKLWLIFRKHHYRFRQSWGVFYALVNFWHYFSMLGYDSNCLFSKSCIGIWFLWIWIIIVSQAIVSQVVTNKAMTNKGKPKSWSASRPCFCSYLQDILLHCSFSTGHCPRYPFEQYLHQLCSLMSEHISHAS